MISLETIILNLNNIRSKLRSVLTKSPNSDLAVSLVKLNAVISELKSLQQEIIDGTLKDKLCAGINCPKRGDGGIWSTNISIKAEDAPLQERFNNNKKD